MISSNPLVRPINTFGVDSRIDIEGVSALRNLKVTAHSDSCTYVYGKSEEGGNDHVFTVSGSSPAMAHVPRGTTEVGEDGVSYEVTGKVRAERGSYTKIMENPQIPSGKFTIGDFATLNELPYPYALKWVKDNCGSVGYKDKEPGVRGKAAELFIKS